MNERKNELSDFSEHPSNTGLKPESYIQNLRRGIVKFFKGSLKEGMVLGGSFITGVTIMTGASLILNSIGYSHEVAVVAGFALGVPVMAACDWYIMPRLIDKISFLNRKAK